MLDMAQSSPQVRQDLEKYASTKNDYLITFLRYATQDESKVELATLLTRDPDLRTFDSTQLRELLAAWNAHGDRADLANHLLAHEKWQAAGWPFLAQHYADQQDFQMACDIAFRYLAAPSITSLLPDQPLVSLEAQFQSNPKDLVEGIMLCQAQINAERIDDALGTITSLEKIKNLPPSIYFLKAQLLVKKQAWADAWNALQQSGVMVSYFQS
jgi:predicted Zn-dependent protease